MKKEAEKRRRGGSVWTVALVLIVIVAIFIFVYECNQTNRQSKDAAKPSSEVEGLIPTRNIEVDENDIPTPDSLKRIEESQAMEEYYREQMEKAEKQILIEKEEDDLSGQPY